MTDDSLAQRIEAVEAFDRHYRRLIKVGDLQWDDGMSELRLLATNYVLRRQLEALEASVQLARMSLGHLAAGFIRPALDELLWMSFLKDLGGPAANKLMSAMGVWDGRRSLLAQREYVGDAVMAKLWYPIPLLEAQAAAMSTTKADLKALGKEHGWNGLLPSAAWLADKAGLKDLTEYLHAATSRSLHFSVGEIQRQCWGEPGGIVTTMKPEFRDHVAKFALYQLPLLLIRTVGAVMPFLAQAGITSDDAIDDDDWDSVRVKLEELGNVPLVHAHEWNLTPEGPLRTSGIGQSGSAPV
jgi:hypothetical protein